MTDGPWNGRKAVDVDRRQFKCDCCGSELVADTCRNQDCLWYGVTYRVKS